MSAVARRLRRFGGWGAGFALLWIIAAELPWLIGEARREDEPMTKAAMCCGNPP